MIMYHNNISERYDTTLMPCYPHIFPSPLPPDLPWTAATACDKPMDFFHGAIDVRI